MSVLTLPQIWGNIFRMPIGPPPNFEIGQVVMLVSGSCAMTIERIVNFGEYHVVWMTPDGIVHRDTFDAAVLADYDDYDPETQSIDDTDTLGAVLNDIPEYADANVDITEAVLAQLEADAAQRKHGGGAK